MQRWKPSCRPTSCPVKPSVLMFCGCHDIWKDLTWFDSWKRLKNEKVWYGVVTLKMRRVLHDGWSNTWNREITLCQLRLRSPSLSGCWVATRDPFMRCDEVSCLTLVCAALSTQIRKCSWCSLLRFVSKRWESPFARNSGSKDSNLLFCKTKRCPWFKGLGGLWSWHSTRAQPIRSIDWIFPRDGVGFQTFRPQVSGQTAETPLAFWKGNVGNGGWASVCWMICYSNGKIDPWGGGCRIESG